MSTTVAALFEPQPYNWGLRGDPYLWKAMAERLAHIPLDHTEAQLLQLLHATFEEISGHPAYPAQNIYLEKFAHGGLSSGYISVDFWENTAIPLLIERYRKHTQPPQCS